MLYGFHHPHEGSFGDIVAKVGGKGASLWMMASQLDLPVPPGFTLGIEAFALWQKSGWTPQHEAALSRGLGELERQTGQMLGSDTNPLLVSVRSGAVSSMPGMMDTVLNVGFTSTSRKGLVGMGGATFGDDLEKRFLSQYGRIVLGLDFTNLRCDLRQHISHHAPQIDLNDPHQQLRKSIIAVFTSWNSPRAIAYRAQEGQGENQAGGGTAVTVQAMVFGNLSPNSCTGVLFTRDPSTGVPGQTGDVVFQGQGEDVVAGTHNPVPLSALSDAMPQVGEELRVAAQRIERHYRDMADIEFTVQDARLFVLQARKGKRSPAAAARIAVDLVRDPHIALSQHEALARLPVGLLDGKLALSDATTSGEIIGHGIGASPGTATGRLVFDPDIAVDRADEGWSIILARRETCPTDVHGMGVAAGIVTTLGGMMSHAAVVARGWAIPAIVGMSCIEVGDDYLIAGTRRFVQGDVMSIDGTSGALYAGTIATIARHDPHLETLRAWAADVAANPSTQENVPITTRGAENHVTT